MFASVAATDATAWLALSRGVVPAAVVQQVAPEPVHVVQAAAGAAVRLHAVVAVLQVVAVAVAAGEEAYGCSARFVQLPPAIFPRPHAPRRQRPPGTSCVTGAARTADEECRGTGLTEAPRC